MRLEPKQEMLDLVPRFEFFREACREFMGNVVGALRLAGEDLTMIEAFLRSMPLRIDDLKQDSFRNGYCYLVLKKAEATGKDARRCSRIADYFIADFTSKSRDAQDILLAAVLGVAQAAT
jgi:hypothetical protein